MTADRPMRRERDRATAPTPLDYAGWRASPLGAITEAEELRAVLELVGPVPGTRVLDVGCGDGSYAVALSRAGAAVLGIDRSREVVRAAAGKLARASAPGRALVAEATELPFREGVFDTVVAITSLCFVPDAGAAVRSMARVLRPGGRLVIGELGAASTWAASRRVRAWLGSRTWRGVTFSSAGRLRELARQAGLVPGRVRGAAFHPPLTVAARLLERLDGLLGRWTTLGAAFIALEAHKPT
jgi:SAM-dependent methyltransferase